MTVTIEKPEADVLEAWQGKWRICCILSDGNTEYSRKAYSTKAECALALDELMDQIKARNISNGLITAFPIPVRGDE